MEFGGKCFVYVDVLHYMHTPENGCVLEGEKYELFMDDHRCTDIFRRIGTDV